MLLLQSYFLNCAINIHTYIYRVVNSNVTECTYLQFSDYIEKRSAAIRGVAIRKSIYVHIYYLFAYVCIIKVSLQETADGFTNTFTYIMSVLAVI